MSQGAFECPLPTQWAFEALSDEVFSENEAEYDQRVRHALGLQGHFHGEYLGLCKHVSLSHLRERWMRRTVSASDLVTSVMLSSSIVIFHELHIYENPFLLC
jgi:hypothetical protein